MATKIYVSYVKIETLLQDLILVKDYWVLVLFIIDTNVTFADIPKNSTMDYKSNSSCSSPSKEKNSDRCGLPFGSAAVPVLPVRNNLRRPNSSHFPPAASRFHFRKGLASRCSWRCTAIVFIMLSVVLTAALSYISGSNFKLTPF